MSRKIFRKIVLTIFIALMLALPALAAKPRPETSVHLQKISSTLEFYEALGSDRTLVFEPGQYNLTNLDIPSKYFDKSRDGSDAKLFWDEVFDGYELRIKGMKNLTLRGTPTPEGGTTTDLIVNPRYAFVIHFEDCENIRIESIVAGHSEDGECQGGVYRFTNCTGVTLDRAEMYGSGTEGLKLDNARDVSVTFSTIFDCTYDIMTVEGGGNIAFENCKFTGNREFDLVNVAGVNGLTFDNCVFSGNRGGKMFVTDAGSKNVLVRNSRFEGNSMEEPIANARNVAFTNCEFD
ncbi:MAG: right-handed parallel beta-helix repeat-containing protein [Synergistaceae bacterium]|jgi:hypothetical protein|nr:right-handed parallel beta-helix repeat-containing protein [Synergistaceae bacterium]